MVFLHGTWGMGFAEPTGHHEMWGWFPCAPTDWRGRQPQHMPRFTSPWAFARVHSLLARNDSLCFPLHFVLQDPNERSTLFGKAWLRGWLWCLTLNSPGLAWVLVSRSLPRSTTIVDFPVLSVDHRHPEREDHVSTLVSSTVWSWAWSPHGILQNGHKSERTALCNDSVPWKKVIWFCSMASCTFTDMLEFEGHKGSLRMQQRKLYYADSQNTALFLPQTCFSLLFLYPQPLLQSLVSQ